MSFARFAMAAAAVVVATVGGTGAALAQADICTSLEAELASLEQGPAAGATGNYRQYDAAVQRQRSELDRATAEAQRSGCTGGFLIFQPKPSPKCAPLMATIARMKANLQRLTATRDRYSTDPVPAFPAAQPGAERAGRQPLRRQLHRRRRAAAAVGQRQFPRHAVRQCPPARLDRPLLCPRRPVRHLPDAVRAQMRRLLLPDQLLDRAGPLPDRRADLPVDVPRLRRRPLHLSQPRRGGEPDGLARRRALFGPADGVPLPQGIRRGLHLPRAGFRRAFADRHADRSEPAAAPPRPCCCPSRCRGRRAAKTPRRLPTGPAISRPGR